MLDSYYSNGKAAVNGYDEAFSAGQDEAFAEDEGAVAARLHNAQEAAHAEAEAREMEEEAAPAKSWLYDLI